MEGQPLHRRIDEYTRAYGIGRIDNWVRDEHIDTAHLRHAGADDLAKEYGLEYDQLGQLLNKNLVGAVSLIEGETPSTGIDDDVVAEEVENTDDSYYTLSGVRISKPSQPGIYIHKGKKIVIR